MSNVFKSSLVPSSSGGGGSSSLPTGTIITFMGTIAPEGYLICDGSSYSTTTYANLANFFNTQFGSKYYFGGSGTTFKVPDLRGEFLRGSGTNSHTNQGSGSNVGTHQDATQHVTIYNYNKNIGLRTPSVSDNTAHIEVNPDSSISATISKLEAKNQTLDGTDYKEQYYTSRPTNTSVLYCIKY